MAFHHSFQDYIQYVNGSITLQEYVDRLCNQVGNNRVTEFLHQFLNHTQEIDSYFDIGNQEQSVRYPVHANDGQVYHYYVRKIPSLNHYCFYIVLPADHPLSIHPQEVHGSTFCSRDSEDQSRCIYGWDYAHYEHCVPNMLNVLAFYADELLAQKIITVETIINDIHSKITYFASIPA